MLAGVQGSLTWLLMVLLTFPGCLCSTWCLGMSHDEHQDSHHEISAPHLCDSHHHHHCCSHQGDADREVVFYEIQTPLLDKSLDRNASRTTVSVFDLCRRTSGVLPLLSGVPKPSGRETLVLLQRFLI